MIVGDRLLCVDDVMAEKYFGPGIYTKGKKYEIKYKYANNTIDVLTNEGSYGHIFSLISDDMCFYGKFFKDCTRKEKLKRLKELSLENS